MHKAGDVIDLMCPKCKEGKLSLHMDVYIERCMSVQVLLYNLSRLDRSVLKFGTAEEEQLGIQYVFICTTPGCSIERFFGEESEVNEYVRYLHSNQDQKSEETSHLVDKKFVSLIRRNQVKDCVEQEDE